jgi:uncharacterized membrane protein (UPF0182 family)
VIGNTNMEEFDFPQGNGNATTRFSADTGIDMSFWNRLLFALRFADINLILNQDINRREPVAVAAQHRRARAAVGALPATSIRIPTLLWARMAGSTG